MRIYLAGLIAAGGTLPHEEVTRNCAVFDVHAARLRAIGHDVVSPVELDELDEPRDRLHTVSSLEVHHACMRRDIRELLTCEAIYMLPGWLSSVGARVELDVARAVGILSYGYTLNPAGRGAPVEPPLPSTADA